MRRRFALVAVLAAALTLSLGLLAAQPAAAGGYGHKHSYKHGYNHGYKHGVRHGHRSHNHRYDRRGFSDSTLLAAVGIVAGAKLIDSYLHRPRAYQPAPIYAVPVQPRTCTQVLVPYASPYGGVYYVAQVQCY